MYLARTTSNRDAGITFSLIASRKKIKRSDVINSETRVLRRNFARDTLVRACVTAIIFRFSNVKMQFYICYNFSDHLTFGKQNH